MRDYQFFNPFSLATHSFVDFLLHIQIVAVIFLPNIGFGRPGLENGKGIVIDFIVLRKLVLDVKRVLG